MPGAVRTAVFPVAGRGTRFLPVTKSVPKELLPVVDKPLIQYAVEEAVAAGATRLVLVTHSSKSAIERHFQPDEDLERALAGNERQDLLQLVRDTTPKGVSFSYIEQPEPLGLGHAVLCARDAVGDEPFFVHLPDDLIHSRVGCLQQLLEHYQQHQSSVIAVEEVAPDQTRSYGIVAVDDANRLLEIVEKPEPADAPSNLGVVGRYLLTPRIFDLLKTTPRGSGGEIQLTDAIAALLQYEDAFAMRFSGTRYDCGNTLGYIRANVDFALARDDLRDDLRSVLKNL
jgi:UTP--glucose-1-phosphate uridylyltransferase